MEPEAVDFPPEKGGRLSLQHSTARSPRPMTHTPRAIHTTPQGTPQPPSNPPLLRSASGCGAFFTGHKFRLHCAVHMKA